MADGTNISLDPQEREKRIEAMRKAGEEVGKAAAIEVTEVDLALDGLNKLIELEKELNTLVLNYGKLILKDAGILKTISDNFNALDNSVN